MSVDVLEACRNTSTVESIRAAIEAQHQSLWHMMPCIVNEDTTDGHVGSLQPAIMGTVQGSDGKTTSVNYPLLNDAPITNHQGGDMVHTMPLKKGDEVMALLSSRPIDNWWTAGGSKNTPIDVRVNSMSDPIILRGMRSNPRKLKWVNNTASHVRSVDAKNTTEHHPTTGLHSKHVDPGDTSADNDDGGDNSKGPFNNAKKFFDHTIHPTNGHAHNFIDNSDDNNKIAHTVSLNNSTHSISMFNGDHTRVVTAGGISDTTKQSHTTTADQAISRTSNQNNITDTAKNLVHNGPTNVNGTLGISQLLTAAQGITSNGLSSFTGGLSTGALEVAPDDEGGLVQATMGLNVVGGITTDTLKLGQISVAYANDTDATNAGVPLYGLYVNTTGGLQVNGFGSLPPGPPVVPNNIAFNLWGPITGMDSLQMYPGNWAPPADIPPTDWVVAVVSIVAPDTGFTFSSVDPSGLWNITQQIGVGGQTAFMVLTGPPGNDLPLLEASCGQGEVRVGVTFTTQVFTVSGTNATRPIGNLSPFAVGGPNDPIRSVPINALGTSSMACLITIENIGYLYTNPPTIPMGWSPQFGGAGWGQSAEGEVTGLAQVGISVGSVALGAVGSVTPDSTVLDSVLLDWAQIQFELMTA